MRRSNIVEEYRIDDLGAPFGVVLERSVGMVYGEHGPAPVIPDLCGLVYETTAARIRHPRRLAGADLTFVRKACEMSREDFGHAIGCDEATIVAYENGSRAIPGVVDRLIRMRCHHMLRDKVAEGRDRFMLFLDWLFEEYVHRPMYDPTEEISFTLYYDETAGWRPGSSPTTR